VTREAESERLAEGIIRLWGELQRRKTTTGEELSTAELTTPQAIALRVVVREGPCRMGALAEALGVTVATASRTVDALAAQKLVRRERDPADARAVQVVATATGKREHLVRRKRFVAALGRLADDLSEHERRQLVESLETLGRLFARSEEPPADARRYARVRAGSA
jgi:DNA-binding MarR family transcriptional regulator